LIKEEFSEFIKFCTIEFCAETRKQKTPRGYLGANNKKHHHEASTLQDAKDHIKAFSF